MLNFFVNKYLIGINLHQKIKNKQVNKRIVQSILTNEKLCKIQIVNSFLLFAYQNYYFRSYLNTQSRFYYIFVNEYFRRGSKNEY